MASVQASVEPPLVFVGRLTEADAVDLQHYHGLVVFRPAIRWAARVGITLAAALGIGWSFIWYVGFVSWYVAAWFFVVWACLVVFLPLGRRGATRRHYRKHEADYLETEVSLGTEGLAVRNERLSSSFGWELVGLILDTPKGMLFCSDGMAALFWLPRRLFEGNRRHLQISQLATSKGVRIRRVS
ncbi:MAG: hypothetical protein GXY83_41095 [Rhodopirellula sp.]|nr:hypothetical protein [Rhodopirellula sp.]